MPRRRDAGQQRLVDRVLRDPALYPDELKAWIPRVLERNPLLKLESYQLPTVDARHQVGDDGEPDFLNSWVNYESGNEVASFYRDPFGRIHLAGLVKDGTSGQAIFPLPGGYRPRAREPFSVITNTGVGRVDVDPTGDVIHVSGGTGYVQLNGISFRAA